MRIFVVKLLVCNVNTNSCFHCSNVYVHQWVKGISNRPISSESTSYKRSMTGKLYSASDGVTYANDSTFVKKNLRKESDRMNNVTCHSVQTNTTRDKDLRTGLWKSR